MSHFVLIVEPERLDEFNQIIAVNAQASVKGEPRLQAVRRVAQSGRSPLYDVYDSAEAFKEHMGMKHTQTFLEQAKELVTKQAAYKLERTIAPPGKQ